MIILSETTDSVQVLLGGTVTTNQLRCYSSWRDITASLYTPGRLPINTNNATPVAVVPAPGASTQRVVDSIRIYNTDTVVQTVTIRFNDNGTLYELWVGQVPSGGSISYYEGVGFVLSPPTDAFGIALHVQALTSSPADGVTVYFGNLPKAPVTTAAISKVYVPQAGTIRRVELYVYSGTAGTNESWSLYLRLNNADDTLIDTLAVSANERIFSNSSLSIPVVVGDYFEIKGIQPTWATNPLTTIYGGYVYVS